MLTGKLASPEPGEVQRAFHSDLRSEGSDVWSDGAALTLQRSRGPEATPGVGSWPSRRERAAEGLSPALLGRCFWAVSVVVLTVAMHLCQFSRPQGSAWLLLLGSFLGITPGNRVPGDAQEVCVQMGAGFTFGLLLLGNRRQG